MTGDCDKKNPLTRDGVTQLQRMLKTLDPSYVAVDEQRMEDLLVFAKKYADYVKYYDRNNANNSKENWVDFFENNVAVLLAAIAKEDIRSTRENYEQLLRTVKDVSSNANYKEILRFILNIAIKIDEWYSQSIEGQALNHDLNIIIKSSLSHAVKKLISFDKGASVLSGWTPLDLSYNILSEVWWSPDREIQKDINDIPEDKTIYKGGNKKKKILSALDHVNSLFEIHYGALSKIIGVVPEYLKEVIEKHPYHEPHIALFLSFLQLFKYAQNHLNKTTKRHLDFYYRDILQAKERSEDPNHVHIIFELAKQASSHVIKSGTLLKAGKDSTGVEVLYKTDREMAANKAGIKYLKTAFIDRSDNYRIYSAPVANSGDGIGGDFRSDEAKWKTLGESQFDSKSQTYLEEEERTMQFAEIGFAVTSPILLLNEGTRKVVITLHTDNQLTSTDISTDTFNIYFSGEKEWIKADITNQSNVNIDNKAIVLMIDIDASAAPVVAHDSKVLSGAFDTKYPVLKIILNNRSNNDFGYVKLKGLQVSAIGLSVEAYSIQSLILQNDYGMMDAVKPYYPLGTEPTLGSKFYIGSKEVFQKKLTYLKLSLDWKDVPSDDIGDHYANYGLTPSPTKSDFEAQYSMLINKSWQTLNNVDGEKSLFNTTDSQSVQEITFQDEFANNLQNYYAKVISEELTEYKIGVERGFIRLELTHPKDFAFGHKQFRDAYAKAVVKYANDTSDTNKGLIPKEPYTPQIDSLKLDYKSSETVDLQSTGDFDKRTVKFFHVYPFGEKEVHKKLEDFQYLLPQFQHKIDEETYKESEGELYIGVSDLAPAQNLSILFQMAEGSANPDLEKQTINWSYLSNDQWQSFKDDELLSDSTNDLITSGIITLAVHKSASSNNTILPSGLHWLRGCVHEKSGAVCDTIDIRAQAVQVSFKNKGNDPSFLGQSLPAETISKLKVKVANIKSVSQPYASFGGRVAEQSSGYYRRVSERLRHKARAVNIWDYERIVLENFPSIYKVICLNHTSECSETAPGSVTIVPISNLRNKNAVDILKPATSVNTLYEIKEYLSKIMSHFVKLEVVNPSYEQVHTRFEVKFYEGKDKGFYAKKLNSDIKKFLSPWAFSEGADISFGGKIHGSYIINFIEERDYVDYITNFELYQKINDVMSSYPLEEVVATSSRSIITSSDQHDIRI